MVDSRRARLERTQKATRKLSSLFSPECLLCELGCGVDRRSQVGVCGLGNQALVYRRLVHLGEELELVPSLAIWLSGCNFECTFCSDAHATRHPLVGRAYAPFELADLIVEDLVRHEGRIRNINFVGGEPAVSLHFLAELALELMTRPLEVPPLLLNTNGWLTVEALTAAIDVFDIFVVDFKFGNDTCAEQTGAPPRYGRIMERNIGLLASSKREVWVRHLLMPGHVECCTAPVLSILETWSANLKVNVMPAFVSFESMWEPLSEEESHRARVLLEESHLANKYWDGVRLGT